MFSKVLRDVELVDALRPTIVPLRAFLAEAVEILVAGWSARGRRRHVLTAAVRHAVDFHTWRSLTADNGLRRAEAVELATALVEGAAGSRRRAAGSRST
jgi:predicted transcriptional regulator